MMGQIMKIIMKKNTTSFLLLIVISVMAAGYLLPVYARDGIAEAQINLFMKALQQIDAKAEPKDDAETIFTYDEGDHIYVTGETPTGWYIVYYQGQTGYINMNISQAEGIQGDQGVQSVQSALEAEELDLEALDDELAVQEVENKLIAEGVERYLGEARRSKIWGAIIVLLVIGIFAVGIVSTIRAEKKDK